MSHTIRTKVQFSNLSALAAVVRRVGGKVIGEGTHRLYAGAEKGFAVKLDGWRYPIVVTSNGEVAFDNYNGSWGDVGDLDSLKSLYTLEVARAAAEAQGWLCEEGKKRSLRIYHPSGGVITVTPAGVVDAEGFSGIGCADATAVIAQAIGATVASEAKAEYFAEHAHIHLMV
jgi:hypothetical protein